MSAYRKPIENLEDRKLFAVTLRGNDTATITASDRSKDNVNDVVVTFSGNVNSNVDISKIRFFGYSNNTILGGQVKSTIPITSATVSGNKLTLRTGVQVRKGAYLTFNSGAVTATDGSAVTGADRLKKGLNRNRFTLALRAFTPGDKSLFSSGVLDGGATSTVAATAESETAVRGQLAAFLAKKVKAGAITTDQQNSALSRFDSAASKAIVGAANLRAAIVSLVGTVAAPAIDVWLGTANTTRKTPLFVGFASQTTGNVDATVEYTSKNRLKLTFTDRYAGESFVALSARIAGETFQDGGGGAANVDSQDEEIVSRFVENVVWAQQVHTDFTYSRKGTTYTHYNNYHLYVLLNSGNQQFPRIGLTQAPLRQGSTNATPGFRSSVASFDALVRTELSGRISDKGESPITAVAASILNNCTGGSYAAGKTTFGKALITSLDTTQGVLGDAFAMLVARDLQVKTF